MHLKKMVFHDLDTSDIVDRSTPPADLPLPQAHSRSREAKQLASSISNLDGICKLIEACDKDYIKLDICVEGDGLEEVAHVRARRDGLELLDDVVLNDGGLLRKGKHLTFNDLWLLSQLKGGPCTHCAADDIPGLEVIPGRATVVQQACGMARDPIEARVEPTADMGLVTMFPGCLVIIYDKKGQKEIGFLPSLARTTPDEELAKPFGVRLCSLCGTCKEVRRQLSGMC